MGITEGLQLPFGIQPVNPVPVNTWEGPYSSIAEAINTIPIAVRFPTMEVRILDEINGNTKYWFKDGVDDSDLVNFEQSKWENATTDVQSIKYGRLYNWYATTDPRGITTSSAHISTKNEFNILYAFLGGNGNGGQKLKETGTLYWDAPNATATNEYGFNERASGYRETDGTFHFILGDYSTFYMWLADSFNDNNALRVYDYYFQTNSLSNGASSDNKKAGCSIRAIIDNPINITGHTAEYIGNDGQIYKCVKIGTQWWLAENLCETKYRDGSLIGSDFSGTDGAVCAYNNDELNVYNIIQIEDHNYIQPKQRNGLPVKIHASIIDGLPVVDLSGKEDAGVAAILISNLRDGVTSAGDTLQKLYNLVQGAVEQVVLAGIPERNEYNIPKLPFSVFILDDGDGKWAVYQATSVGINASFVKTSDPDMLNAVMSSAQIKLSYESNSDTNVLTNNLLNKLNGLSNYILTKQQIENLLTGNITSHAHDSKEDVGVAAALFSEVDQSKWEKLPLSTILHPRWIDSQNIDIYGIDKYGFNLIPGGTRNGITGIFTGTALNAGVGGISSIWTSTQTPGFIGYTAINLYAGYSSLYVTDNKHPNNGQSLRVVRDCTTLELSLPDGKTTAIYKDYDNNIYDTCKIGTQIWITSNLKVTHYQDGSLINNNLTNEQWVLDNTGSTSIIPYIDELTTDELIVSTYGRLYNAYTISNGKGIVDTTNGWKIPSKDDALTLQTYVALNGDLLKSTRQINTPYYIHVQPKENKRIQASIIDDLPIVDLSGYTTREEFTAVVEGVHTEYDNKTNTLQQEIDELYTSGIFEEVYIGTEEPVNPNIKVWYDTSEPVVVLSDVDILRAIRDANPQSEQLAVLFDDSKNPHTEWWDNDIQLGALFGDNPSLQDMANGYGVILPSVLDSNKVYILNVSQEYGLLVSVLNLTGLNNLQALLCGFNKLEYLDLSSSQELQYVSCGGNKLTEINLLGLNNLFYLEIGNTELQSINMASTPNLRTLSINQSVYPIDIIGLDSLNNLNYIYLQNNNLESINISSIKNIYNTGFSFQYNNLPQPEIDRLVALGFDINNILPQNLPE